MPHLGRRASRGGSKGRGDLAEHGLRRLELGGGRDEEVDLVAHRLGRDDALLRERRPAGRERVELPAVPPRVRRPRVS